MKKTESTLKWYEAPDIITPIDLTKILGIGESTAREMFNSKDFPRIKHTGVKQIADKQAVRLWCMHIDISADVFKEIIKQLNIKEVTNEKE